MGFQVNRAIAWNFSSKGTIEIQNFKSTLLSGSTKKFNPVIRKKKWEEPYYDKILKKIRKYKPCHQEEQEKLPSRIWVLGTVPSRISVLNSAIKMFWIQSK